MALLQTAAGSSVAELGVLSKYDAEVSGSAEEGTTISIGDWTMRSRKRPILSDPDKEAMCARIAKLWEREGAKARAQGEEVDEGAITPGHSSSAFTPLPEILFGHSFLQVHHQPTNMTLRFNMLGGIMAWARRQVDPSLEVIKVPEASQWAAKVHKHTQGGEPGVLREVKYDWVFGTDYTGELLTSHSTQPDEDPCETTLDAPVDGREAQAVEWVAADERVVDMAMLQSRDPILYYDDLSLYEDELHDHGLVSLSVKARVMPKCWFVLLRYWLRVDGMLMRVQDTRYFHAFGSNEVGRSQCRMEVTWQQLREANLPTESNHYTDPNRLIQLVGQPPATYHKFTLSRLS